MELPYRARDPRVGNGQAIAVDPVVFVRVAKKELGADTR